MLGFCPTGLQGHKSVPFEVTQFVPQQQKVKAGFSYLQPKASWLPPTTLVTIATASELPFSLRLRLILPNLIAMIILYC
jgi:hypothetical protein